MAERNGVTEKPRENRGCCERVRGKTKRKTSSAVMHVSLASAGEKKRKTKCFCEPSYVRVCVSYIYIFLDASLCDSASWNSVPSIYSLFPRDRPIDDVVHSGRRAGDRGTSIVENL